MSRCLNTDNPYNCRNCRLEYCIEKRAMIDSSLILNIIKNEDLQAICEEKLKEIKKTGQAFITHIGLAEIYKGTLDFIEKEIKKQQDSFNVFSYSRRWNDDLSLNIISGLKKLLEDIKIVEIDKESISVIKRLFEHTHRMDMGNRDRIILGTAESHNHNFFLFRDRRIKDDEITIKKLGFKIILEFIE